MDRAVIPAKAGIQAMAVLTGAAPDSRFRGNDDLWFLPGGRATLPE
jgi:hypothetical protein